MATETSNTIRVWGDATFGEVKDLAALVSRARGEQMAARPGVQKGLQAAA